MITAVYDDALAEMGLKVSQFSVLNAVANREDTRPAELAKFLEMDESTLSRNVVRMCARRWTAGISTISAHQSRWQRRSPR